MIRSLLPGLFLSAAVLTPAPAADTIHRVDGDPVEDCRIREETLVSVTYKPDSGPLGSVPSDDVLSIEFSKKPDLIDEAETALFDGDSLGAMDLFEVYLDGFLSKDPEKRKRERYSWAPPYAAYKVVELRQTVGDLEGVSRATDRLVKNFPESRYLPMAYLAKANALSFAGKLDEAQSTLNALNELIQSKSLSQRWQLECNLALIQTDRSLGGSARRDRLAEIETEAGTGFPTVRSRASVARGESFLDEARAKTSGRGELIGQAKTIFEQIVVSPKADDETLAGAFAGLGDCLFEQGAKGSDQGLLREACLNYMRVVVVHKDQSRYVAKSLFYAGRCFDLLEEPERAQTLYRAVQRQFPESSWAGEARGFRRGR